MKIVVIGDTGLIGSNTVAIFREEGDEVVAGSPKSGVNTITGKDSKRPWSARRWRSRQFAVI